MPRVAFAISFLVVLILCIPPVRGFASNCLSWFQESGINPADPDCEAKCALLTVDMGTFNCPAQCVKFCRKGVHERAATWLLEAFYGEDRFTDLEKRLISEYPMEAFEVALARVEALSMVKQRLGKSTRIEADAFRHFVWTGLIAQRIGIDPETGSLDRSKVMKWVYAHEADEDLPAADRGMDLWNDEQGWNAAVRLYKTGKLTPEEIEKAALEALKGNKLRVSRVKEGAP